MTIYSDNVSKISVVRSGTGSQNETTQKTSSTGRTTRTTDITCRFISNYCCNFILAPGYDEIAMFSSSLAKLLNENHILAEFPRRRDWHVKQLLRTKYTLKSCYSCFFFGLWRLLAAHCWAYMKRHELGRKVGQSRLLHWRNSLWIHQMESAPTCMRKLEKWSRKRCSVKLTATLSRRYRYRITVRSDQ